MRAKVAIWGYVLLMSLMPAAAAAQGFAGLGRGADGYAVVDPDMRITFPRDHGPHPDFRIEWWYITANLTAEDGTPMGVQWTVFRNATAPEGPNAGWAARQLWMGHAAVTTPETHKSAERFARGGIGQAGAVATPEISVWLDDWQMHGPDMTALHVTATGDGFSYDLQLDADGPIILHGQDGYSVKSEAGQASYYFSQPHYRVTGQIILDGAPVKVEGQAWLDREWSSQPLSPDQTGWDWFSLRFETGEKMMIFGLRDTTGARYVSGTWISPQGETEVIPDGSATMTPLETSLVADRDIPTRWRLEIPGRDLEIEVEALNPDSYMATAFPYWEGPVTVTGSHGGIGYLEMTGY